MYYCTDTWFLLKLFGKDNKAKTILEGAEVGKDWVIIPIISYAETIKKLFQEGRSENEIDTFFSFLERANKVKFYMPDREVSKEAAKISLSFGLPLMDAFVAATAKITGCNILLAKDSDYDLLEKRKYVKIQSW